MKIHRFFVEKDLSEVREGSSLFISLDEGAEQWRKVLRLVPDEKLVLFGIAGTRDSAGKDILCKISDYEDGGAKLIVEAVTENNVRTIRESWLFASIVKKDTFEWIVEKATEIGVSHIVPIVSERSEKKSLNIERLKKIIIESAEQSGRAELPVLHEVTDFKKALSDLDVSEKQKSIVWEPQAEVFRASKKAQEIIHGKKVMSWIGPEGGWSKSELDEFKKAELHICSLGPQILRAETAVASALSLATFL